LAQRAERVVEEILLPYVWADNGEGGEVAVVSHGLCISELIKALVRRDRRGRGAEGAYKGFRNTAWSCVTVELEVSQAVSSSLSPPGAKLILRQGLDSDEKIESPKTHPLLVQVTAINQHEHLFTVVGPSPSHMSHTSSHERLRRKGKKEA
jgi:hypothetical protein